MGRQKNPRVELADLTSDGEAEIRRLYLDRGKSMVEVATAIGLPRRIVSEYLNAHGLKRTSSENTLRNPWYAANQASFQEAKARRNREAQGGDD